MRRTLAAVVPTKETEQAGAKRLSSSEARARIEGGGGGVTLMKKMVSRRTVDVGDLLPAKVAKQEIARSVLPSRPSHAGRPVACSAWRG